MTDRELIQMALDALDSDNPDVQLRIATAIRARLAQPDPEPVAWRWLYAGKPEGEQCFSMPSPDADIVARAAALEFPRTVQHLYTAPPKRKPNPFDGRTLSDYDNGYLHGFDDAMENAATPPQREWRGLTDEEAFAAFGFHLWPETFLANAAQELKDTHEEAKKEVLSKVRAIEAKLKEKNT